MSIRMETQNTVVGRKLSAFVSSMTEASSSMARVRRIIPMVCVLSTLAGCWSPTAEQQVAAVAQKLQELNPEFDGKVTPTIFKGVVVGLEFCTDNVTDISPVRARGRIEDSSVWRQHLEQQLVRG